MSPTLAPPTTVGAVFTATKATELESFDVSGSELAIETESEGLGESMDWLLQPSKVIAIQQHGNIQANGSTALSVER